MKTLGTVYHVSPSGSDRNPGTQESPFATIQRAADVVFRQLKHILEELRNNEMFL